MKILILERFLSYVEAVTERGCWIWIGADTGKYGLFWNGHKYQSSHRASYNLFKGEIPEGLNILHTCDVTFCVNPKHLYAGTQKQNLQDSIKRGRYNRYIRARGSNCGRSRLTEDSIIDIRNSICTRSELSHKYNVAYTTIQAILNFRSWKHIGE